MKKTRQTKTVLELLSEKSHNAINLVLTTIENLKDTNKAINDEKQKNDEIILGIQTTNDALVKLKNSNEKIISNFENLLK